MNKMGFLKNSSFSIILFFLLVIEGSGIAYGRETVYLFILFLPTILFVNLAIQKQLIVVPTKITVAFLAFLAVSLISTVFGANIQRSFEYSLYLISIFSLFLYAYNKKSEIEKALPAVIIASSIFFVAYTIILGSHLLSLPTPLTGFQFVFSQYQTHNHLGDFLILPVIMALFYLYKRKSINSMLGALILVPFIIFSYSRSAYFDLLTAIVAIHLKFTSRSKSNYSAWIPRLIIVAVIVAGIILLITTTKESNQSSFSSNINAYLVQNQGLSPFKALLAYRPEYFAQAIQSIAHHPLLGIGPDNFIYASRTYTTNPAYGITSYSHNLFIDVLTNNGVLGLIPFIMLLFLAFWKSKKDALFFVLLAMFFNFQTDYTYSIYSFFLLFFVIAAVIHKGNEKEISAKYLLIPSVIVGIIAILMLVGNFFTTQKQMAWAFFTYPLQREIYQPLIEQTNGKQRDMLLGAYERIFPQDPSVLEYLGQFAEQSYEAPRANSYDVPARPADNTGSIITAKASPSSPSSLRLRFSAKADKRKALSYYEKSVSFGFFQSPRLFAKVYSLKLELEGQKSADDFKDFIFSKIKTVPHGYLFPNYFKADFENMCSFNKWQCPNFDY